jgi:glycosyltransferase involved in cell wall biosynthesis
MVQMAENTQRTMDGVVLVGNPPFYPTGYGNQLRMLGRHLSNAYRVLHICDYGYTGPAFELDSVEVHPVGQDATTLTSHHLNDTIANWTNKHSIERYVILALGNTWKWGQIFDQHPSIVVFPVDCGVLSSLEVASLQSSTVVATSAWGQEVLQQHGIASTAIPHCWDAELDRSRSLGALRSSRMSVAPPSKFLVGFFGDCTERKCPVENLSGFREFAQGKNDVQLWIHHSEHKDMVQAPVHPSDIITTEIVGNQAMADSLGALDVLLHASSQEGFGVFQIEAQASGTPVINTDTGPMSKLNAHADLVVPSTENNVRGKEPFLYNTPDPVGISVRLQALYDEWKLGESRRTQTQDWASQFSSEVVCSQFDELISSVLDESFPEIRVIPPTKVKRIGIVSTWGVRCGIATYTQMLRTELERVGLEVHILAEIGANDADDFVHQCWDRSFDANTIADTIVGLELDLVHVQHEWALFRRLPSLWSSLSSTNAKIIATFHTPDFGLSGSMNHQLMDASRYIDGIVLHNKRIAQQISGQLMSPVQHIPHGVREFFPQPDARSKLGVPDGIPVLLNYGFPFPTKGTLELLKAIPLARNLGTPYFECLIVAGRHDNYNSDSYISECRQLAEITDGVLMTEDFVPDEELDALIQASDFLVYPYAGQNVNSSSGALMRAIHSATPIISTDEGRLRDLVGGVHCWKAQAGDVESLAVAIQSAVQVFTTDRPRYDVMSSAIQHLASGLLWPDIAGQHHRLYDIVSSHYSVRGETVEAPSGVIVPLLFDQKSPWPSKGTDEPEMRPIDEITKEEE